MKNVVRAAVLGASAGLIVMGGAIAQEHGWMPLASAESVSCYEDEPCWDSKTMGDHEQGRVNDPMFDGYPEDWTVCRWNGSSWTWAYSPVEALNLPCPFAY